MTGLWKTFFQYMTGLRWTFWSIDSQYITGLRKTFWSVDSQCMTGLRKTFWSVDSQYMTGLRKTFWSVDSQYMTGLRKTFWSVDSQTVSDIWLTVILFLMQALAPSSEDLDPEVGVMFSSSKGCDDRGHHWRVLLPLDSTLDNKLASLHVLQYCFVWRCIIVAVRKCITIIHAYLFPTCCLHGITLGLALTCVLLGLLENVDQGYKVCCLQVTLTFLTLDQDCCLQSTILVLLHSSIEQWGYFKGPLLTQTHGREDIPCRSLFDSEKPQRH